VNKSSQITVESGTEQLWLRAKSALLNGLGWCLEKSGAPAKLKEFEFVDPETNETIYLSTGTRYLVLHIGNKKFFFDRATGVFDGTSTLLQDCVANRLELGD
jgi:hypothetical protein